ncbi:MAG: hypothetical protein AAFZ05_14925, partial [Pseudomonadota bacterium]
VDVVANFRDVDPSDLGAVVPDLVALKAFAGRAGGRVALALSPDGALTSARMTTAMRNVAIRTNAGRDGEPRPAASGVARVASLDLARIDVTYDPARGRVSMAPSTFRWAGNTLTLIGTFRALDNPDNAGDDSDWAFSVSGTDGRIALADGQRTLPFDTLNARGRYLAASQQVKIKTARLAAGGGSVAATGTLDAAAGEIEYLFADVGKVPLDLVGAVWPPGIAEDTRAWFLANVKSGAVSGGTVTIDRVRERSAGNGLIETRQRMFAALDGTGIAASALEGLPVFSTDALKLRIADETLEISADRATASVDGTPVSLKTFRYATARIWSEDYQSEAAFELETRLPAVVALAKFPQLQLPAANGALDDIRGDGQVTGTLRVEIPNISALTQGRDTVRLLGTAKIADAKLAGGPISGRPVEKGDATVTFARDRIDVDGRLRLSGVPAKLKWTVALPNPATASRARTGAPRRADPSAARGRPLTLTAELNARARRQLGLAVGKLVQGTTPVTVTVDDVFETPKARVALDLTPATLEIFSLNW